VKLKIGITAGCQSLKVKDRSRLKNYITAIESSGGKPELLTFRELSDPQMIENLDGLLLTGGGDIPSYFWGEVSDRPINSKDENRALLERPFIHYARAKGMPILGVCLGLQVINVALGGSLYIDFPNHKRKEDKTSSYHNIHVVANTKMSGILPSSLKVNSRHHQAIKDLAPGIRISAKAEDGVIEGIESEGAEWIVGVQWHPEDYVNDASLDKAAQKSIFQHFISSCQSCAKK
jgi:putative glutamine amidotransferase